MAETGMTLQVSPELVRPVIEQKIQAAIVAEFARSGENELLAAIVNRVLTAKVDNDGNYSRYSDGKPFIEWLCEKAVREAAEKAIREWITKNQEKFTKHFEAELAKRSSGFAKVFADGLLTSIKSSWQFHVNVAFDSPKDR